MLSRRCFISVFLPRADNQKILWWAWASPRAPNVLSAACMRYNSHSSWLGVLESFPQACLIRAHAVLLSRCCHSHPAFQEVCDLRHGHKVSHMWLACSCCPPVNFSSRSFSNSLLQLLLQRPLQVPQVIKFNFSLGSESPMVLSLLSPAVSPAPGPFLGRSNFFYLTK